MEFEAKVLIDADKYAELMFSSKIGKKVSKTDEYWSKYSNQDEAKKNGESLTRLRVEGDKCYLTLKHKTMVDGFEKNEENEARVDYDIIKQLLKEAGYKSYFRKHKDSCYLSDYTVNYHSEPTSDTTLYSAIQVNTELEIVSNYITHKKFYAIEVEAVSDDASIDSMKDYVFSVFKNLGYTEKDFEKRSWQELLKD